MANAESLQRRLSIGRLSVIVALGHQGDQVAIAVHLGHKLDGGKRGQAQLDLANGEEHN